jgi:hypothetical protein
MEMLLKQPFLGNFTLPMTMDTYLSKENPKSRIFLRNGTKSTLRGAKRGTNPGIKDLRQNKKPTVVGFS